VSIRESVQKKVLLALLYISGQPFFQKEGGVNLVHVMYVT